MGSNEWYHNPASPNSVRQLSRSDEPPRQLQP